MVHKYYPPPPPPARLQPPASPPPRYVSADEEEEVDQSDHYYHRITIHGLIDIYRSQNIWLRIFWLITFIAAIAAALYGCYHIVEQYAEAPVVVSYFVQEFDSSNFPLPDIVVCPFNRFNSEVLKEYNISAEVAQYMQMAFGSGTKHPNQRRELMRIVQNITLWDLQLNETLERFNLTFRQMLEAASLKCEELFVDCYMPDGPKSCCERATGMMTFAGKCYRIKSPVQVGPGYGFGMSIVVSLPKHLYTLAVNNFMDDGIVVKLAEPNQGIDYDLTFIPVGTHALMPLKATQYEFINNPPKFICMPETQANYSRVGCFDSCFMETAQEYCQCSIVTNSKHSRPACTAMQFFFCVLNITKHVMGGEHKKAAFFYNCRRRCKPRCTYWQYQTAVSYTKFPVDDARVFVENEKDWERMKNSIILDVYYERLEFTKIKHLHAMTLHGFVANLGGQCSLWLGASILTLFQILALCIAFVYKKSSALWQRTAARPENVKRNVRGFERPLSGMQFHTMNAIHLPVTNGILRKESPLYNAHHLHTCGYMGRMVLEEQTPLSPMYENVYALPVTDVNGKECYVPCPPSPPSPPTPPRGKANRLLRGKKGVKTPSPLLWKALDTRGYK